MFFSSPGVKKKDLSKAKRSGFSEPTLQRQNLKKIYVTSNHICVSEAIQTIWLTESSQKLNLQTESRHLSKNSIERKAD